MIDKHYLDFDDRDEPEARWPALVSTFAVGGLYLALPASLSLQPRWLLMALVVSLLIPTIIAWSKGYHDIAHRFGMASTAVITIWLIISLCLLISTLDKKPESAVRLLESAGALWLTNIFVFALWYWRLDAGGPHQRDLRPDHEDGAFLFPQMVMSDEAKMRAGEQTWSPTFVDYLFLAFNTSTALSPTDTAVLSRWAKILMMIQACISLMIVVLLAARAINIL